MKHSSGRLLVLIILFSFSLVAFLGSNADANPGSAQPSSDEFLRNFAEALDIIQVSEQV